MQNKKIFLAGHNGLVGSAFFRALKKEGYEKIITKSSKELDLRRQKETEDFFATEKPDIVILCAAKVGGIYANNTYPAEFIYDNLMIASNVINSAYKYKTEKLINLGSSCIYPKNAPQPIKEEYLLTGLLEPTNEAYAIAKISAIKLCSFYNKQYGTNFISLMPTNMFGVEDNYDLEKSHVLPALIKKFVCAKALQEKDFSKLRKILARTEKAFDATQSDKQISDFLAKFGVSATTVTLWGTGVALREFMFSDDLAAAGMLMLKNYSAQECGELVNVGYGEDISIKDLAKMVKEISGFTGTVLWDSNKPDGTMRKLMDSSKIKKLGFTPNVGLKQGIERVISEVF